MEKKEEVRCLMFIGFVFLLVKIVGFSCTFIKNNFIQFLSNLDPFLLMFPLRFKIHKMKSSW